MNSLETVIEQVINPSAKDMRVLKEAIMSNTELASLFNGIPNGITYVEFAERCHNGIIRFSIRFSLPCDDFLPRTIPKLKPNKVRCEAVIWNLEMDETTGELKPKRCTRKGKGNSLFCKQHGLSTGIKCTNCSHHFGKDVVHEFQYEHMGTIHDPSYIFVKHRKDVEKIYYNSIKKENREIIL